MFDRLKNIHPGWVIGGFFAILIVFNLVFFTIAITTPVHLVPRAGEHRAAPLDTHEDVAPVAPTPETPGR